MGFNDGSYPHHHRHIYAGGGEGRPRAGFQRVVYDPWDDLCDRLGDQVLRGPHWPAVICGPRRKEVGRLPRKNHENFHKAICRLKAYRDRGESWEKNSKNMETTTFFHGSSYHVNGLKSSLQTGNIRKGEESRKELRDVIFLTTSQNEARNYAGEKGYVYVVEARCARKLCALFGDKSVTIWVAYPQNITIIRVICPDGRIRKPFKERILLG